MASIQIVLYKSKKLKNGEHPIMLRIIQNRKTKYISSGHSCDINFWDEQKQQPKRKHPNYKELMIFLEHKQAEARKKLLSLEIENESLNVEEIQSSLKKKVRAVGIIEFVQFLKEENEKAGKYGNARVYRDLKRVLKEFLNSKDVMISRIDQSFLRRFEVFASGKGWKPNTSGVCFRTLRATLNKAVMEGFLKKERNPFQTYSISHLKNNSVKKAITREDVKRIEQLSDLNPSLKLAKDYFLFSYYCSGLNFKDFCLLRVSNVYQTAEKYFLTYTRSKTGKELNIQLVPQAVQLFQDYATGKAEDEYLFPILNKNIHNKPNSMLWRI